MKKLLLADDSVTIQKVVELVLADEGFELKLTSNGEEALEALSSFRPDIVLADVDMPRMNGYELSQTIKSSPATNSIPVILMVGAFETVDEGLIKKAGADDYVIKPFESHDLISKLRGALPVEEETAPEASAFSEALSRAAVETGWAAGSDDDKIRRTIEGEGDEVVSEKMVSEEYVEEVVVPQVEELHSPPDAMPSADAAQADAACPGAISGAEKAEPENWKPRDTTQSAGPAFEASITHIPLPEKPVPEEVLSPEEINAAVSSRVGASIDEAIGKLDLARIVTEAATPAMTAAAQKIVMESLPRVVESLVSQAAALASAEMKEVMERMVRQAVPELAESIIKKEIESIKREI
ncbi:MAG: response regulator [Nitrospiraceae bacterium]|nr:response regulator [Nitrospiraceae bacterium]